MKISKLKKIIVGSLLVACSFSGISEAATPEMTANAITNYIVMRNTDISYVDAQGLSNGISYYSAMYGVDPLLMTALFDAESSFHQSSVSSAGAIGIGQIMPDTAVALGVNPYDTMQNIQGACSYIGNQLKNFSNWPYPIEMALAAYNAGAGAVIQYGGIPPYAETQNYVKKIRDKYYQLQQAAGTAGQTINWPSGQNTPSYGNGTNNGGYVEYVEKDAPTVEILDQEDY